MFVFPNTKFVGQLFKISKAMFFEQLFELPKSKIVKQVLEFALTKTVGQLIELPKTQDENLGQWFELLQVKMLCSCLYLKRSSSLVSCLNLKTKIIVHLFELPIASSSGR